MTKIVDPTKTIESEIERLIVMKYRLEQRTQGHNEFCASSGCRTCEKRQRVSEALYKLESATAVEES